MTYRNDRRRSRRLLSAAAVAATLAAGLVGSTSASAAPATVPASSGPHLVATVTFPKFSDVSTGTVDPASGRIYLGNPDDNRVWSLDPSTFAKTLLQVGDCCGQGDMAFDPVNHTLFTVGIDDGLYSLNVRTKKVGTFPVPSPQGLAFNPVTQTLYVSDLYANKLYVVDARTHHLRATLVLGPLETFLDVAVNASTNTVYVIDGNELIAMDGTTYAVRGVSNVGQAGGIQVDPATNTVYLLAAVPPSSPDPTSVVALDGRTLKVIHRTSFAAVQWIWVDSSNGLVYVVHDAGGILPTSSTLSALNGRTGHLSGSLRLSFLPSWVTGDGNRGRVYLVDQDIHPRLLVVES